VNKKDGSERSVRYGRELERTRERPGPFELRVDQGRLVFERCMGAKLLLALALCQLSYPLPARFLSVPSFTKSSALARAFPRIQLLRPSNPLKCECRPHPTSRRPYLPSPASTRHPAYYPRELIVGNARPFAFASVAKDACRGAVSRHHAEQEIRLQAKGKGRHPPAGPWIWVSEFSAPLACGAVVQDTGTSTAGILLVAVATCPALGHQHPCRCWHPGVERWLIKRR
jgi:hypothetical protein